MHTKFYSMSRQPEVTKAIEAWFDTEDWSEVETMSIDREERNPHKFFWQYVPKFWTYLNLIDVIGLAFSFKGAAYTAYDNDIHGFQRLCNMAWFKDTLDLKNIPILNENLLREVIGNFFIRDIIYPVEVTENVLCHLPFASSFTFNLSSYIRYMKPQYPHTRWVNISINSECRFDMWEPTIEILAAFPKIRFLSLFNVEFNRLTIAALGTVEFRSLCIQKCTIFQGRYEHFIQALLNSKHILYSISISFCNHPAWWNSIVEILIENIKSFTRLHRLFLPFKLTWKFARILLQLYSAKNLEFVTLETDSEKTAQTDRIHNFLERRFANSRISLEIRYISSENASSDNDDWLDD